MAMSKQEFEAFVRDQVGLSTTNSRTILGDEDVNKLIKQVSLIIAAAAFDSALAEAALAYSFTANAETETEAAAE